MHKNSIIHINDHNQKYYGIITDISITYIYIITRVNNENKYVLVHLKNKNFTLNKIPVMKIGETVSLHIFSKHKKLYGHSIKQTKIDFNIYSKLIPWYSKNSNKCINQIKFLYEIFENVYNVLDNKHKIIVLNLVNKLQQNNVDKGFKLSILKRLYTDMTFSNIIGDKNYFIVTGSLNKQNNSNNNEKNNISKTKNKKDICCKDIINEIQYIKYYSEDDDNIQF